MIIMMALHWTHAGGSTCFLYLKSQNGHNTPGLETTLILSQDMQSETVIQIITDAESKNDKQQYPLYFVDFHSALLG